MHNLNLKGWNSHVHRESPRHLESTNLRENLSREIGRGGSVAATRTQGGGMACDVLPGVRLGLVALLGEVAFARQPSWRSNQSMFVFAFVAFWLYVDLLLIVLICCVWLLYWFNCILPSEASKVSEASEASRPSRADKPIKPNFIKPEWSGIIRHANEASRSRLAISTLFVTTASTETLTGTILGVAFRGRNKSYTQNRTMNCHSTNRVETPSGQPCLHRRGRRRRRGRREAPRRRALCLF